MLERYYRYNSVLFLVVVTVVGGLTTNLLLRYSTVQYSTVQYSTVQYSKVQYSTHRE